MNLFERDQTFVAPTYARFPVQIVKGKGSLAWDETGKEYIDLGSGIGVNALGFSHDGWIAAVTAQLNQYQHTSNLYYTDPCATLAQTLCERTGMKNVFFSNSGAEANECGIKAARKYAADHKGAEYTTILTLNNSFHGRTLTTLAATGQAAFHEHFTPLTEGFVHIDPTPEALQAALKQHKVAAVMVEVVRGEGGVLPLTTEFTQVLSRLTAEQDVLLFVDEVQTGNGRTGTLYGYMQYGLQPDIVTTAKGLGGGLPIGATLLGEKTKAVFSAGLNGSTFGGNPVCCAGANYVLQQLDDTLFAEVREKSAFIFNELSGAKGIESVTGMGLMIGVKTVKPAKEVVQACLQRGVLLLTAKDKVRLLPALNIPKEQLETAITILKDSCAEEL